MMASVVVVVVVPDRGGRVGGRGGSRWEGRPRRRGGSGGKSKVDGAADRLSGHKLRGGSGGLSDSLALSMDSPRDSRPSESPRLRGSELGPAADG